MITIADDQHAHRPQKKFLVLLLRIVGIAVCDGILIQFSF